VFALLAVEFLDELVSSAWTAAWPLIRTDLGLTYVEVGLLLALPALFASVVEPAIGLLGDAWNRRTLILGGGIGYLAGLLLCAASGSFLPFLLGLLLLYPAGGAFIELSQVALMDAAPARHEQNMARWALAGSVGMLLGPAVLSAATVAGSGWRAVLFAFAALVIAAIVALRRTPIALPPLATTQPLPRAVAEAARAALRALRRREVVRWLALLQFADLMLDVLFAWLALYFVDVVGLSGAGAAVAIAVWIGVGLAGDVLLLPLLERVDGVRWLRLSALLTLIVFPAFLLVDGVPGKLALLGLLGILNAGWYAILKGRLYSALPGQTASVMALGSVSGLFGALLPLGLGAAAETFGLDVALWLLLAAPVALLVGLPSGPEGID
jgi:MFS transporter, FSR family, fosmidomycin resistance protein